MSAQAAGPPPCFSSRSSSLQQQQDTKLVFQAQTPGIPEPAGAHALVSDPVSVNPQRDQGGDAAAQERGAEGGGKARAAFTLVSAAVVNEGTFAKMAGEAEEVQEEARRSAEVAALVDQDQEAARQEKHRAHVLQTAEVLKWYHGTTVAADYLRSQGYGARWC
eukprot:CAMPEP_0184311324 /NCGR_PEP_ID=MMETSP1049-20130417/40661_1 /TAXON_ID=77928 /ORGANISM="Proteomonas sulcata, Strain CCMP704" /LENGTH=162 /DNA_ID=CAMNT_0026626593 /DNA_START=190 /DNA_END=680 /DNA_ORIENTATION=+